MNPVQLKSHKYRLGYHVMASSGWINDPNGFCYFKGYYHIFYQYYPYSEKGGSPMHWGHARSKDLVHWETLPIALTPGDPEDTDGCFSGSAIVKDDTLYLIYTGHHFNDSNQPEDFWENQNMAYSQDGIHFTKYEHNPIIATPPADNTQHFRDPKVWQYEDVFYMILGSQGQDGLGRALLYKSSDLKKWEYQGAIDKSKQVAKEGFMWECPDLFELKHKHVLLFSPQGIEAEHKKFLNLFQTGYFIGHLDYAQSTFNRDRSFIELDNGHDFYAAQTTLTPDGRTVVIGWMDMWENDIIEQEDGWAGALTLPRTLNLKNNKVFMNPVEEVKHLRTGACRSLSLDHRQVLLSDDSAHVEVNLSLKTNKLENDTIKLALNTQQDDTIMSLTYNTQSHSFTLFRSDHDDCRYADITAAHEVNLRIFIDKSSVEIFINDGETCFTERYYYPHTPILSIENTSNRSLSGTAIIYKLKDDAIQF
ncbi:sucrose-6-phosphate hydrolase [Staphylococcus casei]|uniref:glycoside hydrolase family 32 protein n=1 Tax=Staphylococcus TaxID=1279 RepID=UPI000CD15284|nr:sucrose-6-phosphate hydrolase [Staphylococcus casei]PNZ60348.1 sucrose-6-phosphate hydrolase [Staphylococcus casei]WJE86308.1 sucrose-6-phosphate hydrolase [Staphylococcus casei]